MTRFLFSLVVVTAISVSAKADCGSFFFSGDGSEGTIRGLKFDPSVGVVLNLVVGRYSFETAKITLAIAKENQDSKNFDRMYALLLKGMELGSKLELCGDGKFTKGADLKLSSVEVATGGIPKVQVCGSSGACATVEKDAYGFGSVVTTPKR